MYLREKSYASLTLIGGHSETIIRSLTLNTLLPAVLHTLGLPENWQINKEYLYTSSLFPIRSAKLVALKTVSRKSHFQPQKNVQFTANTQTTTHNHTSCKHLDK